ncbi:Druantia anti-phage system protein DruA [Lacipirellula limnantheis]|uniref:Uncharacterized protein n=1 Tax=Lacipirellula limnantheis TaxID=2528024 RepID=A0A517TSJ5_9BACT|nr:Druantia anti-phage system protein DruA [Lacipirellula limnantheis]QDT71342.1 hypothetical protein I41_04990 [Lacipirellula limnantheis]
MITRTEILQEIGRPRLRAISVSLGMEVSTRKAKAEILSGLISSRRFSTAEMLERLTHGELKAICKRANVVPSSRDKAGYIHGLTGDDGTLLKAHIIASLRKQGFRHQKGRIVPPSFEDKETIRTVHGLAVQHKRDRARAQLMRYEKALLSRIAEGVSLDVTEIRPRLVEVVSDSEDELLFRYACLHWSIPISSGYGRRLRFIVIDESNQKLVGVIGLGDPVFALSARDEWIGFTPASRKRRLQNIMDAFVLGAVPPYSYLLGGKLIAMLAASNEVRERFKAKYGTHRSLISGKTQDGDLALLTTTSALGRSSIYNRIRYQQRQLYTPIGYTRGFGDFQFLNGLYDEMLTYAKVNCSPTAKQLSWGAGFRNRREVVKKCLASAGLPSDLLRHGVRRQIFVVPLALNAKQYLSGVDDTLQAFNFSADEMFGYFRERWMLPRAARLQEFRAFRSEDYGLWIR